ncbi:MAG: SDR family oxidoreductase [Desulfovibrionaceae bacterium]|nr:SDR family oxidoreductase [Desulfovibrionaceae bacterium]
MSLQDSAVAFTNKDLLLVTGASSGLGQAGAILLNRLGAKVIGVGRDAARLKRTQALCPYPEHFFLERCDLTENLQDLAIQVGEWRKKYGRLRGLLYCAGTVTVLPAALQGTDEMRDLFDINVFAAYQLARGFLDRRNNMGEGSSIVFLASLAALRESSGTTAYASSKGAVISLARSLACEYLRQKIRVNSISPGLVPTPMTARQYADLESLAQTYPLGPGRPEDIANTAAFLLSPAARWITGQNLVVDGGRSLV